MNITLLLFVTFSLLIVISSCVEPPLWPEWFSQSMSVDFGDLKTTGSYFYDSQLGAQRYDFANGNSRASCGSFHQFNTPCTYLIRNGWLNIIYPEKNICCKLDQFPITPRDWLQNYVYRGQEEIDGQYFDVWGDNLGNDVEISLIFERNGKQRPRRQTKEKLVYFDYWMNSYSQKKPDLKIFQVPQYCQKRCWDRVQDLSQMKEFLQGFNQLRSHLTKSPTSSTNENSKEQ